MTKKKKNRIRETQPIPYNFHINSGLQVMFGLPKSNRAWPTMLRSRQGAVNKFIAGQTADKAQEMQTKLKEAKDYHSCIQCGTYEEERIVGGFLIGCINCDRFAHVKCVREKVLLKDYFPKLLESQ